MLSSALARAARILAPLTRGMTLGVRCCCIDAQGRVFLVRHSYVPGWYLPGGGVERGETALDALLRELSEEGGIRPVDEPQLFGIYHHQGNPRDHILLYVSRAFERPRPPCYPNREILEAGFFAPDALPPETSSATRRRLGEVVHGTARDGRW